MVFVNIFRKGSMPNKLPKDMQKIVDELSKTRSQKECLEKAYKVVTTRFKGCMVFTNIWAYFTENMEVFWNKEKHTHCTNLNYILEILLVKSGKFQREDIKVKWTLSVLSPHQYLQVKVDKKLINVDPFAGTLGAELGDYIFGLKRLRKYIS